MTSCQLARGILLACWTAGRADRDDFPPAQLGPGGGADAVANSVRARAGGGAGGSGSLDLPALGLRSILVLLAWAVRAPRARTSGSATAPPGGSAPLGHALAPSLAVPSANYTVINRGVMTARLGLSPRLTFAKESLAHLARMHNVGPAGKQPCRATAISPSLTIGHRVCAGASLDWSTPGSSPWKGTSRLGLGAPSRDDAEDRPPAGTHDGSDTASRRRMC